MSKRERTFISEKMVAGKVGTSVAIILTEKQNTDMFMAERIAMLRTDLFKKRQMLFASQIPEVCELLYITTSWMVGLGHQS